MKMTEKYLRPAVKESGSFNERLADLLQRRVATLDEQAEVNRLFVDEIRALVAEKNKS